MTIHIPRHVILPGKAQSRYRPPLTRSITRNSLTQQVFANPQGVKFAAAADNRDSIPTFHGLPEVIVTGRANVGKSTLLNAIMGRKALAHMSKKPGRTQTLNFYLLNGDSGSRYPFLVVDTPGYGERGRPEWGQLFEHYTKTRKELKRIYILINAKHGLNDADRIMLETLSEPLLGSDPPSYTLQAILTKGDTLISSKSFPKPGSPNHISSLSKEIFDVSQVCLPPIVTALNKPISVGVDAVRQSIVEACGFQTVHVAHASHIKWYRGSALDFEHYAGVTAVNTEYSRYGR